ncbi:MAG TPA: hypothetical protein VE646_12195 [Actinomycetota bacterium]|nr:hypothetical protein [Actinomycetota bacterium]
MGDEDFVRVYATGSITDGYLARGRLEAEGIPVLVKGEGEGPYRMGPVYLWVPAGLEVQARMILDEVSEHRTSSEEDAGDPDDEAYAGWDDDA